MKLVTCDNCAGVFNADELGFPHINLDLISYAECPTCEWHIRSTDAKEMLDNSELIKQLEQRIADMEAVLETLQYNNV